MQRRALISQLGPLIMLAAGLAFAIGAFATLDLGTVRRLGPGAFPLLVGGLLCCLALVGLVQNLRAPMETDRADPIAVLGVIGGVAAFAGLTPLTGVLPAAGVAVFVTGSAIPGFRWPYRFLLSLVVVAGIWLIFVEGLGMPFVPIRWP